MDDEEKNYWDGVMQKVNVKLDDILDKLAADRASLTLSQRISKLEEAMRKGAP